MKRIPLQDNIHIDACTRFCEDVESLIQNSNKRADEREALTGMKPLRLTYVDAVLSIAEGLRIEPDMAAGYLNPEIRQKMAVEWQNKNMLPKSGKLPF